MGGLTLTGGIFAIWPRTMKILEMHSRTVCARLPRRFRLRMFSPGFRSAHLQNSHWWVELIVSSDRVRRPQVIPVKTHEHLYGRGFQN